MVSKEEKKEGEETEKQEESEEKKSQVVEDKPEEATVSEAKEGEASEEAKAKDDQKQAESEQTTAAEGADLELKEYESVDTITDQPVRDLDHIFEDDETLKEDLERLRALQQEMAGETDEELEKFKCRLIEEMPLTLSQEEGIKHYQIEEEKHDSDVSSEDKLKVISGEKLKSGDVSSETQDVDEADKKPYDDVYVEAIPGIGGVVPDNLISTVIEYMKDCAKNQHGMVMPRNIRHYNCPPLEPMDY